MKNRELRMKLLALGMAGAMTISLCGCGTETTEDNGASAAEAAAVTELLTQTSAGSSAGSMDHNEKEETVYVIAGADGSSQKVIVSDWLKNGLGDDSLTDITDLSDIKNVKGDETFAQSGSNLTWDAAGNDIYYQGTSTKKLPVEVKITYTLDGAEVNPDSLAGKSGHVVIRFDYTNNEKTTATIDGKQEEIYIPFLAMSGMMLDTARQSMTVRER